MIVTVGALLAIVLAAGAARAQTTADSTPGRGVPVESVPPSPSIGADSSAGALPTGQADGTAPTSSGVQPPSAAPPTTAAAAAAPVATASPSDTILARACAGAPPGSEAPGLLAVVFRPGTPDAERAAAARAVGGTLGGPTEFGEEYVRVRPDAGPLAAVADRLIRQAPVTRVSPAPCPASTPAAAPSPPPPTSSTPGGITPAPTPGDSLAPPDTSSGAAAPTP